MRKFFKALQTNYIVALVIVVVAYFLYPPISRYEWKVRTYEGDISTIDFFVDADGDGESEYLKISDNEGAFGSLTLYNHDDLLLNLTNLPYAVFARRHHGLVIEDLNNNGMPEIAFLAVKKDSLNLIVVEYKNGKISKPNIKNYPLDLLKPFKGKYRFVSHIQVNDVDLNGDKEIIIMITSGYTIMPRRMYLVHADESKVFRSPISGAGYSGFVVEDIDGDNAKEIVLQSHAFCNIYEQVFNKNQGHLGLHDSILLANKELLLKYNDCTTWISVLDSELNYKFDPVAWGTWTGRMSIQVYPYQGEDALYALYSNFKDSLVNPILFIYDADGTLMYEKEYINSEMAMPLKMFVAEQEGKEELFVSDKKKNKYKIDQELNVIKNDMPVFVDDRTAKLRTLIDDEELTVVVEDEHLKVYDSQKKIQKSLYYPGLKTGHLYTSLRSYSEEEDVLMVDIGSFKVQLRLSVNLLYKFRYPVWVLVYLMVWVGLWFIQKVFSFRAVRDSIRFQKIVAERTQEIEKQKDNLKQLATDLKEKSDREFQQNLELEKRRAEIESLYDKLTSSVTYGKGIKDALLPSISDLKKNFTDFFVFFRPKNVVGGDFYWFKTLSDKKIIVIGDASGEGISGGFLSLLAISLLNEYKFKKETKASDVLKAINHALYKHLSEYLRNQDDGIEMAVLMIDNEAKGEAVNIQFSSANIALHYFASDTILNMKTILPNDYCLRADVDNQAFKDIDFELPVDSALYLSTKGLYNQIGGDDDEVFGEIQLSTYLQRVHVLPKEEQLKILIEKFDKWQAANEQTDDVLCIGLKV